MARLNIMHGVLLLTCVHLRLTQAGFVGDLKFPALFKQIYVGQIARTNKTCGAINATTYQRQTVTFPCSGVTCEGWLYRPKRSIAGSSKPPVIVMGHGLGGEKPFLDRYASRFADSGFAVFSFDYRCWGDSDGSPRRSINPVKQRDDWFSAVEYVQTNISEVDSSKLSLWGTSFAGGHVITVAAKLGDQVKSVIAQVPHLDGRLASGMNMLSRGPKGNFVLSIAALADATAKGDRDYYIPLAGPAGSLAIMQLGPTELEAYFKYKNTTYTKDPETGEIKGNWTKFLTCASLASEMSLRPYNPTDVIAKATAPILIIAAKRDELCPYSAAQAASSKGQQATLLTLDCVHFEVYNQPWRDQAVAAQLDFIKKHGV